MTLGLFVQRMTNQMWLQILANLTISIGFYVESLDGMKEDEEKVLRAVLLVSVGFMAHGVLRNWRMLTSLIVG